MAAEVIKLTDFRKTEEPILVQEIEPRRPMRKIHRKKKKTKLQIFWQHWSETIKFSAIILLIVFIAVWTALKINNHNMNNKMRDYGREKIYTAYTVKYGETVWSISRDMCILNPEYPNTGKYAAEIMFSNHINYEGDIKAGDTIILPYFVDPDCNTGYMYDKYGIDPYKTFEN